MQGDIDDPDIVGLLQDESRAMSAAWLAVNAKQLIPAVSRKERFYAVCE